MKSWVFAGALVVATTGVASAQDVAAGEQTFGQCGICHAIGEGATIKLGPPLNGLDGRKSGTFPGFNYSDAVKSSGITWGTDTFKQYITNPQAMIPGNRMGFGGLKDDKVIANLWAFLSQFDADGHKK